MVDFMAKKIPEHIAYRLAQKAKAAETKVKEAEKKVKEAEKKANTAEKKAKTAEKKAKTAEKKVQDAEEAADDSDDFDDLDDLDDLDDFDDFDTIEDAPGEESGELEEEPQTGLVSENADNELEALMKQASSSESSEQRIQRANRFANEGDFDGALEIWKDLTASEAENPENWRGIASVLDQRNLEGDAAKAQTARDHSDRIETQVIADKTGRKMEDIIADLMDDGVLNFSAGSDAQDS
jgi:hypothetical protein